MERRNRQSHAAANAMTEKNISIQVKGSSNGRKMNLCFLEDKLCAWRGIAWR